MGGTGQGGLESSEAGGFLPWAAPAVWGPMEGDTLMLQDREGTVARKESLNTVKDKLSC